MNATTARILVADDDPTAQLLFRSALKIFGYEVSVAADGADALRQFRSNPFDMVVLDIDMPVLNGHQVCAALRSEADPLLPILMATGMDDIKSVEDSYREGATDFISKPMNWALIGHRVKNLLRGHKTMLDLRAAVAHNAAILQAIPDALFEIDGDGRFLNYHEPNLHLSKEPAGETRIGKTMAEVLPPAAAQVCMAALREAERFGASTGKQFELQSSTGNCWFELSVARKSTETGQQPHFVVLSRDISKRKQAEHKIQQLAFFDSLTGLPNRPSFLKRTEREIKRARRSGQQFALLFADLDGFKNINDTLGHAAGDKALQWAAERLSEAVRSNDPIAIADESGGHAEMARMGGDEFTALILNIASAQDALRVAQRIREVMRKPFVLGGLEVALSVSIGIAIYPQDGDTAATLLKNADTALYHVKQSGRDNFRLYDTVFTTFARQRLELEADLRQALERAEFSLVYQPQIDVASGRIQSVEALLRWHRPGRELMKPSEFVPVAEECGLILPIGRWVLAMACADAMQWQSEGYPVRIAVNLSATQFKDPELLPSVLEALANSGLPAERLELEFTESAVIENTAGTVSALQALRESGVQLALDDFGTGYSSLSYLKRLPLNNIKIDRSFISGLPDDVESCAIVHAILAMAGSLKMHVTAEGVETSAQAELLENMACDQLQGYYFSKPVTAAEMTELLKRNGAAAEQAAP